MLKVVIIGYGEMFTNLIAASLDAKCDIVGVLRAETIKYPKFIRWLKDLFNPSLDYNYIRSYNLKEIKTKSVNSEDFQKTLLKLNPDIILVGSWPEKFKKNIYSIPKIATINTHPSLLPKYRGPNPYFWVIKNQEKVSGVTFHLMDDNYDSGAILAQEEVEILPNDTSKSLKQRIVLTARGVACELLNNLKDDIIIPLQQREDKASYFSYPDEFELNFDKSASENYALIRAHYPWNYAYFYHKTTPLTTNPHLTSVEENNTKYNEAGSITYVDYKTKTISVLCGDNKILKMSGIMHFKKYDQPFTQNYIKQEVKIGDLI